MYKVKSGYQWSVEFTETGYYIANVKFSFDGLKIALVFSSSVAMDCMISTLDNNGNTLSNLMPFSLTTVVFD